MITLNSAFGVFCSNLHYSDRRYSSVYHYHHSNNTFLPLNPTWPAFSWFPLSFFSFFRYFTPSFPFFFPVSSLSRPMLLRWGKFKDLWRHGKTGEQKEHHSCSSLLESTEKKIAGKKRIKQEWSSQTGAARLEQSDWSCQDGAGSILGLGHHFV